MEDRSWQAATTWIEYKFFTYSGNDQIEPLRTKRARREHNAVLFPTYIIDPYEEIVKNTATFYTTGKTSRWGSIRSFAVCRFILQHLSLYSTSEYKRIACVQQRSCIIKFHKKFTTQKKILTSTLLLALKIFCPLMLEQNV